MFLRQNKLKMKPKFTFCALKAYLLLLHTLSFTLLKVVFSQKIALSLLISQYFYRYDCENIRYEKFRLPKKY